MSTMGRYNRTMYAARVGMGRGVWHSANLVDGEWGNGYGGYGEGNVGRRDVAEWGIKRAG